MELCSFFLQHLVFWLSSILDKENMFRNKVLAVFPTELQESRNFFLLCALIVGYVVSSVDSQLAKLSRDHEIKLNYWCVGGSEGSFYSSPRTWSTTSQINSYFSLPLLLFFFPRLCPLLDVRAAREQMHMGGVTYPTLPLQEAVPRPQSGYGHHSAACSPTGSFNGSLPPHPHSAYFSGMTGPQHPFYNRVRQKWTTSPLPTI